MESILNFNNDYSLEITNNYDDYFDFNIRYKNKNIGILQLRIYDEVFIRQISIDESFRRKGHAENIINELIDYYQKTVSLCIATISESAIAFWKHYLSKKENVENPKGNVYKIYYKH